MSAASLGDVLDALVIGGGPGGLTGALYLARFRRSVLVVDDEHSRAVRIPRSHNMPGYPDGVPGSQLVGAMRLQAERYGVRFLSNRVVALEKTEGLFVAHLAGQDGCHLVARSVLLATGTSDLEPPMPYLAEALRSGALRYCPVCDGYEVIGQSVGVVTNRPEGAMEAVYLRSFTDRLTLFVVSPDVAFSAEHIDRLQEAGVKRVADPVDSIRLWEGKVTVRHGPSETVCDAIYGALGMQVHSELAGSAERDKDDYLLTDNHYKTTIDGLYAAGDVVQGLNQIAVAVGSAAIAAAAMHRALGSAWKKQG